MSDSPRHVNQACIDLIKTSEGCKLEAYPDPASGGDPWTVGYGDTGPDVVKGLVITQEGAENRLKKKLDKFERSVEALVKVPMSDNEFAALVDFCYNEGIGNLQASTLLKLLNAGNPKVEVAEHFKDWNKARVNGVLTVLPGLTTRRQAEKDLFLKP